MSARSSTSTGELSSSATRAPPILLVSTELDEVLAVGDRIAVMFEGRIVGILEGPDATYENLGLLMGGAEFGGGAAA